MYKKIKIIIVLLLFLSFSMTIAQNRENHDNGYSSNLARYNESLYIQKTEYKSFRDTLLQSFNTHIKQQREEYNRFTKNAYIKWGEKFELSKSVWVEYSEDTLCAGLVDFEKGVISFHTLNTRKDTKTSYRKRVKRAFLNFIYSKGTNAAVPVHTADSKKQLLEKPLLPGIVADKNGTSLNKSNVNYYVDKKIEQAANFIFSTDKRDGKYVITLSLTPNYLKKLAKPYLPIVAKYAERFNLNPSLILAMIHTESFFNPMAKSDANAIGLMQLVADKGGLDAYVFVYGKGTVPSIKELYNPGKNIMLGCAYLHILNFRFFCGIHNQQSKIYCSISGYNTGAHNVARAFTGKRHIGSALIAINQYNNSNDIYNHLIRNLPYSETREYLKKVVKRMELYR